MSDEIKVNSENTPPRKNLATLGQVKDALDKRDKKIDSLKEDIGGIYAWQEITSIEVVDGKLLQLKSKEEYIATDAHYSKTEIPDNVKKNKSKWKKCFCTI